jgi:hypothetical protein
MAYATHCVFPAVNHKGWGVTLAIDVWEGVVVKLPSQLFEILSTNFLRSA